MNLRKIAKGKDCMVRIPGICNRDAETTVLAHVRMSGITGYGQKAPDFLGAWCCSDCHRHTETTKSNNLMQRSFLEGVMRTQYELITSGEVKI